MMGFKDKSPIKTTNLLAEDTWRTFLTFLIIVMPVKMAEIVISQLILSQVFQKGAI